MSIDASGLNPNPEFYNSMVNSQYIDRLGAGGGVGDTILTVVGKVSKVKFDPGSKGGIVQIPHGFKKAYEVFIRYKPSTVEDRWTMLPTIDELGGTFGSNNYILIYRVTESFVEIEFFETLPLIDLEIYFVEFTI